MGFLCQKMITQKFSGWYVDNMGIRSQNLAFYWLKSHGYIPSKTTQNLCKNSSIFEICWQIVSIFYSSKVYHKIMYMGRFRMKSTQWLPFLRFLPDRNEILKKWVSYIDNRLHKNFQVKLSITVASGGKTNFFT